MMRLFDLQTSVADTLFSPAQQKRKLTFFSFYFWQECNERIKRLGTFFDFRYQLP